MRLAVKSFSDIGLPVLVTYQIAPSEGVHLRPDLKVCNHVPCTNSHIFYMYVIVLYNVMSTVMTFTQANYRLSSAANGVLVSKVTDKGTVDGAVHDRKAYLGKTIQVHTSSCILQLEHTNASTSL